MGKKEPYVHTTSKKTQTIVNQNRKKYKKGTKMCYQRIKKTKLNFNHQKKCQKIYKKSLSFAFLPKLIFNLSILNPNTKKKI